MNVSGVGAATRVWLEAPGAGTQHGFTVSPPAGLTPAAATVSVSASLALDASLMLALQEREGGQARDREARRHCHRLLLALSALQRAMLSGEAGDVLADLSRLVEAEVGPVDPELDRILRSVRLRARLELARIHRHEDRGSGPDA